MTAPLPTPADIARGKTKKVDRGWRLSPPSFVVLSKLALAGFHRMTAAFFQEGPVPDQMSNEIEEEEKPVAKKNPPPRPSRMDHMNDFFVCVRLRGRGKTVAASDKSP